MNNPATRLQFNHAINEAYRVYQYGKLVAQGTAAELQLFFKQRARTLRVTLRETVRLPDDEQLQNKYQIETEAEFQAAIQSERNWIEAEPVLEPYVWPEDLDEHELLFNPNSRGLKEKIRQKKSRHHRYYRKHLVSQWKQEQREISEGLTEMITEVTLRTPDAELEELRKQRLSKPANKRADKYRNRLTPTEANHLEQKQAERTKLREAMQAKYYK